jgi:hypothetical protein
MMSRAVVKDGDDLPEVRAQVERTEPYPTTALGRAKLEAHTATRAIQWSAQAWNAHWNLL